MTKKYLTVEDYTRGVAESFFNEKSKRAGFRFTQDEVCGVVEFKLFLDDVELGTLRFAPGTDLFPRTRIKESSSVAKRDIMHSIAAYGDTAHIQPDEHARHTLFVAVVRRAYDKVELLNGRGEYAKFFGDEIRAKQKVNRRPRQGERVPAEKQRRATMKKESFPIILNACKKLLEMEECANLKALCSRSLGPDPRTFRDHAKTVIESEFNIEAQKILREKLIALGEWQLAQTLHNSTQ